MMNYFGKGLQKHKEWSNGEVAFAEKLFSFSNSNVDISFVFSVPLSAVCVIAYDKNMAINIEIDYIPEWL
jgi:hypothetical protein